MKPFFELGEDFESIIRNTLSKKEGIVDIVKISPITTGWTNIVYRVETTKHNYFFRFPRDDFWERTIVKDYEFAKYIYGKTSFETVKLKLGMDEGRPFSFHVEIPGHPLAERINELSEKEVKKISKKISQFMYELHSIKYEKDKIFDLSKNIGFDLYDFIDELLKMHVSFKDRFFWILNNFKMKEKEPKCLVHGDFNSSNVLLDDNNNVKAIIDFGFGGFGEKYQDISRIIGRCPNSFKQPIIESYFELSKEEVDYNKLEKEITAWKKIDQGYINYMRKIGIYS